MPGEVGKAALVVAVAGFGEALAFGAQVTSGLLAEHAVLVGLVLHGLAVELRQEFWLGEDHPPQVLRGQARP